MDKKLIRTLEDVFADPDFDKLVPTTKVTKKVTANPEIAKFLEIQTWVNEHGGVEPKRAHDLSRMEENKLASRLNGIRNDSERIELLLPYDDLGLLKVAEPEQSLQDKVKDEIGTISSLDDILNGNAALLGDKQVLNPIFDTSKYQKIKNQRDHSPKNIAKRKKVANFDKYRPMFKQVQSEIASGVRKLVDFKANGDSRHGIEEHQFYVLNGQLLYVESISSEFDNQNNKEVVKDARVHVIYENGTENNPLRNGLRANLYGNASRFKGKIVTEPDYSFKFGENEHILGSIYVLSSESSHPEVLKIKEQGPLYKVGVTMGSLEKRIANAENEATYLYGPVKVVAEYSVANLKPEALETAIHHALVQYQLQIDITGPNGNLIHPREWFAIDLATIDGVIKDIVSRLQMSFD